MARVIKAAVVAAIILTLSPGRATAPEMPHVKPVLKIMEVSLSRGEPSPKIEKRVMRVSAYTNNDPGMDGKGITASGELVQEGVTIAAPPEIPFGTEIYIPELGRTYTVTDRGGAIQGNRLDLYMEDRMAALEFGVQELDVLIRFKIN